MQILIVSDIHGNLPALELVLAKEKKVDLIISLGDVVNYGPWSNECVELLNEQKNKILLLGNHEEAFISSNYKGTNLIAKEFFNFCYPQFTQVNLIKLYKEKYEYNSYQFIHTLNNEYIFPDTKVELTKDTFIGHSHRLFFNTFNGYKLVNVGSVGQNRLNIDEINYVLLNTDKDEVILQRILYNADVLLNEMCHKKYPKICIDYIQSKRVKNNAS